MEKRHTEEFRISVFEAVDHYTKDIAQARRMSEIMGVDVEEFDKHLNECCTKWHDYYADMGPTRIAIEGVMEIAAAGNFEEFMEDVKERRRRNHDGKENS